MLNAAQLTNSRLVRYGIGSVVALGTDLGLFIALLRVGMPSVAASALGYCLGILIHWLISSRLVFADGAAARGPERTRQKGLFVASALAGLAITTAIVAFGTMAGLLPVVAKLIAIVVSFQATYVMRKTFVFVA
jgi:putative flippase GtrA